MPPFWLAEAPDASTVIVCAAAPHNSSASQIISDARSVLQSLRQVMLRHTPLIPNASYFAIPNETDVRQRRRLVVRFAAAA